MNYNDNYTSLAEIYDDFTVDVNYSKRFEYLKQLFLKHGGNPALVLDLACGTGSMTTIMAKNGYDMIGIDASAEMLDIARKKSIDSDLDILYLNQYMDEFELYGTVDAVICLLDSINYLTYEDEILRTFSLVHNYLNPGGLFIFDLNTPHKLENILAGNTFCDENKDVFYVWRNSFDPDEKVCEFALDFFIRNGDNYSRHTECHYEKAYETDEMNLMLSKSGLTLVGVYDDLSFSAPSAESERIYYVAKKEN